VAITFNVQNSEVVTLDEFMEYVHTSIDVSNLESVSAAAPMLRGLANERELVVRRLNWQIKNLFATDALAATQVLFLAGGRDFYVRANLWPSLADLSTGRVLQDHFGYHLAHDHAYHFMTVGYHGPGYHTDIYQYDTTKTRGFIGERVELQFKERLQFRPGMVMLYEASKDVHTQQPPEELSITLNLMISSATVRLQDQYLFDLEKSTLVGYPQDIDSSRRASLLEMAAHVGNENTRQLLHDLSSSHPSRRTRVAAYESLAALSPESAISIWERACKDKEPLVSDSARKALLKNKNAEPNR
jgi:hypothetical protein